MCPSHVLDRLGFRDNQVPNKDFLVNKYGWYCCFRFERCIQNAILSPWCERVNGEFLLKLLFSWARLRVPLVCC